MAVMLVSTKKLIVGSSVNFLLKKCQSGFYNLAVNQFGIHTNNFTGLELVTDAVLIKSLVEFCDCIVGLHF